MGFLSLWESACKSNLAHAGALALTVWCSLELLLRDLFVCSYCRGEALPIPQWVEEGVRPLVSCGCAPGRCPSLDPMPFLALLQPRSSGSTQTIT